MSNEIVERAKRLSPFLAMEIMERAFALEREGVDIAHLEIGEPDFPVPPVVIEACTAALQNGETRYTDSRGLPELREAIADDHARRFGVTVDSDRILVTSGTSPAALMVFSLLVEAGDEVIMASPHYPCYPNFTRYCGGVPVPIATSPENRYRLDPDAVKRALTSRTRAIVVNSPANPTGAIQDRATLETLASLGVPLVSDEIYAGLVYGDAKMTSASEISENVYVLDGFSKRYAMTGFRLGYVIAPRHAMRTLQIMQQNLFISASRFVQHAGVAALRHGAEHVENMRQTYERRRDRLVAGLRELGFGIPHLPDGAFYILADATPLGSVGSDSLALATRILDEARVGVTPGIDFGEAGEGKLRFCYAVADETIDIALERLAEAMPRLLEAGPSSSGESAENGERAKESQ